MAEVTMPRLSDTMSEGAIGAWLKQPGDTIENGEIIAEIETDKATMELQAFESGVLQQILVPVGETVAVGTRIAMIGASMDAAQAAPPAADTAPASGEQQAPTEEGSPETIARTTAEARAEVEQPTAAPTPQPVAPTAERNDGAGSSERIIASPLAQRVAEENGVNLSQVQGTGPGGRIIRENVEDFIQQQGQKPAATPTTTAAPTLAPVAVAPPAAQPAPAATKPAGEIVPMSRMRRAIARAMNESKPGIPHIYVANEIDMGEALKLRKQINDGEASDVKISVNDIVIKAAAKALRKFPTLNSSYATTADGQPATIQNEQINVSVAVALDDGLIAPVVKNTDQKDLSAIASEIKDLAGRAREGKLKQNELEGATFQVSNLGMFDVVAFVSIITVPQVASLAVGASRRVAIISDDGQVSAAQMMTVVLSVDHRVVDGATAARYLQELKRLLQSPMRILV